MSFKSNIDDYDATQAMIDINALHLNGLRTECVITEAITQAEIRSVETKLLKLFGRQTVERQIALLNKNSNVPSPQLYKWLNIVGLNDELIQSIIKKIGDDFNVLLNFNENELNDLISDENVATDERRRFLCAMSNLKLFIDKLKINDMTINELDLHWDSWDQTKLIKLQNELSYTSKDNSSHNNNQSNCLLYSSDESKKLIVNNRKQLDSEYTNLTTKSSSKESFELSSSTPSFQKNNFTSLTNNKSITPPMTHKYKTNHNRHFENNHNASMPKSKSHEGHLTNKIDHNVEHIDSNCNRSKLVSESCTDSRIRNSRSPPVASPDNLLYNAQSDNYLDEQILFSPHSLANSNLNVPRSPRTQGMLHAIHHRFSNRIWPKTVICNLCERQMMFGFKCKECKYRCHRECASKVPPLCGLPPKYFEIFKETINSRSPISSSSNSNANSSVQCPWNQSTHKKNKKISNISKPEHMHKRSSPDSSSNASSRNSSAPASPIQLLNNNTTNNKFSSDSTFTFNNTGKNIYSTQSLSLNEKKDDLLNEKSDIDFNDNESLTSNNQQQEENLSLSNEFYKNHATRLNSQDSQNENDQESIDKTWPRQNSMTLREWNIPFGELITEKEIGTGRFGTVFKGNWHGHVAIKMFNMANGLDNSKALEAFRSEVATFRKTRHENLVLFMGACMAPPHLAIVTSYCKGEPLFEHLYERNEKFTLNRIISVGRQVALGMGYLHARGIIHKDLRSKNIFFDCPSGKVTISDFGFFSLAKLCFSHDKYKDRLKIPKGWLCYLAPELMKALKPGSNPEEDDLPFSFSTDIFSFGTILHEMIFGFLPFDGQPAEVVIWQVSKGIKQSLINLQASKEIKDILMICWSYKPSERPEFSKISEVLTNLPKKRLQRSPSHPTHLVTNNYLY